MAGLLASRDSGGGVAVAVAVALAAWPGGRELPAFPLCACYRLQVARNVSAARMIHYYRRALLEEILLTTDL